MPIHRKSISFGLTGFVPSTALATWALSAINETKLEILKPAINDFERGQIP